MNRLTSKALLARNRSKKNINIEKCLDKEQNRCLQKTDANRLVIHDIYGFCYETDST